jgi:hypothetical protein
MRKTKLKKISKMPISRLQRKIWDECKRIVRKRYPPVCYTCGQTGLEGANLQTGHVPWPKASLGAYQKYCLDLLKIQCFRCNIHLGGNGAVAYAKMLKEIGPEAMASLEADRQKIVKAYDFYVALLEKYKNL